MREQQVELHYYDVTAPRDGIVGDIPVRVGDRVTVVHGAHDRRPARRRSRRTSRCRSSARRSCALGLPVRILDGDRRGRGRQPRQLRLAAGGRPDADVLVKARIENRGQGAAAVAVHPRPRRVGHARGAAGAGARRVAHQRPALRLRGGGARTAALVARQRPLRVGEIVGNDYVVLEGIKPGDRVIVSGTQFLQDGAPVSPQT